MNNKKGFTLIELLAVIIILGILMIIAIPSVTKYISDSRKSTYIDTAKEIISGARNMVNDGKLEMFDTDTTYYIDINCIKTESGTRSPYGSFTKAYVVVTYDGKGYDYYWTSVDDAGEGIRKITKVDNLDTEQIESDLKNSDISNSLGIDGRNKYMIIDKENTNCKRGTIDDVSGNLDGVTGNENYNAAQQIGNLVETVNVAGAKRFTGANPNNYVYFNGELWRIIGAYGNNLKIIRTTKYGFQRYNDSVDNGNDWGTSKLKNILNNDFYNELSNDAKNMITDAEWMIGRSMPSDKAPESYSSIVSSATYWTGKVGILSPYEYLYAASEDCYSYKGEEYPAYSCQEKDWLYMEHNSHVWLLSFTPTSNTGTLTVSGSGGLGSATVNNTFATYPIVYLKSSVKITGGSGTYSDPYQLQ